MIFAGIGCRKGADGSSVVAAIRAAFAACERPVETLAAVATSAEKSQEEGIRRAAAVLGVPLLAIARDELQSSGDRTTTRSERVLALTGVGSLAEAAALAAAGERGRLVAQRIVAGAVACALAQSGTAP